MNLTPLPGHQINSTRRRGTKSVTPTVVGFVAPPSGPDVRIAIVATRAVGNAVRRNQAKRYLRAAVREVTWSAPHDVVLHARARTAHAGTRRVVQDLQTFPAVRA